MVQSSGLEGLRSMTELISPSVPSLQAFELYSGTAISMSCFGT